jgi:hypothetical protein
MFGNRWATQGRLLRGYKGSCKSRTLRCLQPIPPLLGNFGQVNCALAMKEEESSQANASFSPK